MTWAMDDAITRAGRKVAERLINQVDGEDARPQDLIRADLAEIASDWYFCAAPIREQIADKAFEIYAVLMAK